jgi:hypothetical protein
MMVCSVWPAGTLEAGESSRNESVGTDDEEVSFKCFRVAGRRWMTSNKDRSCGAAEEERSIFYLLWVVESMPGSLWLAERSTWSMIFVLCHHRLARRQTKIMRV